MFEVCEGFWVVGLYVGCSWCCWFDDWCGWGSVCVVVVVGRGGYRLVVVGSKGCCV